MGHDIIHGHDIRYAIRLAVGSNDDVRQVVLRRIGALMVTHFELPQADGEGQGVLLHIGRHVCVDRVPLTQVNNALTGRQMSEQCTGQDDKKRNMEHDHRQTAHTSLQEIEDCHSTEQCPQG